MPRAPRLLRRGVAGTDVAEWQRYLVRRGYTIHPDGWFGRHTEAATKSFQRVAGLTADGIVGPATRAAAERLGDGGHTEEPPQSSRREVPRVTTPLTPVELMEALAHGHSAALGTVCSRPRLACAWAQCMLEHARGRAVYCHNIGNVTGFGWSGPFYVIRVQERVKRDPDVWKWVSLRFRSHPSPQQGAADYWRLMVDRYSSALALFDAGKPHDAAYELSRLNYYTARAEKYAPAMVALYRKFPG